MKDRLLYNPPRSRVRSLNSMDFATPQAKTLSAVTAWQNIKGVSA